MADKRCFVQFPHPGGEHGSKSGRVWNITNRDHQRKFMQFRGKWIDEDGITHADDLRAWGEWEPESKLIAEFDPKDSGPHHPAYLWKPYWIPRSTYRGLHNTDPFIFGDCFLYSNCHQPNQIGLRSLAQGSLIAFGSKVKGEEKWALDTVLVVRESRPYDPTDPSKALKEKVPDEFLEVTGGPLSDNDGKPSCSGTCAPPSTQFRLYHGATPDDPVDEMFSFFPAVPASRESSFARPVINLADKGFNPRNFRTPKGATNCRKVDELRHLWDSLVTQIRNKDLVLGTRAELPIPCTE